MAYYFEDYSSVSTILVETGQEIFWHAVLLLKPQV